MVLNNVILSTPIVCIVLVIINISIILHGHTMKNIMVYLLNFNITYIIILATCFDYYESSSGINLRTIVHIALQFYVLHFCISICISISRTIALGT